MKKLIMAVSIFLSTGYLMAETVINRPYPTIQEVDGTPKVRYPTIVVPNGSLTDMGTYAKLVFGTGGGGGGGGLLVCDSAMNCYAVSTGVYSSAFRLVNDTTIYWTLDFSSVSSVQGMKLWVAGSTSGISGMTPGASYYYQVESTGNFIGNIQTTATFALVRGTHTGNGNGLSFNDQIYSWPPSIVSVTPGTPLMPTFPTSKTLSWGGTPLHMGAYGVHASSGQFDNDVRVGSMTSYGTITSSTGFIGKESSFTFVTINNVPYQFPVDNGSNNEVLKTDGNGILDWVAQTGGGGGASALGVGKDLVIITSPTNQINFTGAGVSVADQGDGTVTVTINGGSSAGFDAFVATHNAGFTLLQTSMNAITGAGYYSSSATFSGTVTSSEGFRGGTSSMSYYYGDGRFISNIATVGLNAWNLFKSTGELLDQAFQTYKTTGQAITERYNLGFSTLDAKTAGSALFQSSFNANTSAGVYTSSINATGGIITSSSGFIGGGSSFTTVNANYFIGDGSKLSGVTGSGDNLGNHLSTRPLNMAGFPIDNVSSFTMIGTGDPIISSTYSVLRIIISENLGTSTTYYFNQSTPCFDVGGVRYNFSTASAGGFTLFVSSGERILERYNLSYSTLDAKVNGWQLFRSTGELFDQAFQVYKTTGQAITERYNLSYTTGDNLAQSFQLYKTTGQAITERYNLGFSTMEGRIESFHSFKSTGQAIIERYNLGYSTADSKAGGFTLALASMATTGQGFRTSSVTAWEFTSTGTIQGRVSSFTLTTVSSITVLSTATMNWFSASTGVITGTMTANWVSISTLVVTSSVTGIGFLRISSIAHNSVMGYALQATNAPADTQVPKYDSATGKITWSADSTAAGGEVGFGLFVATHNAGFALHQSTDEKKSDGFNLALASMATTGSGWRGSSATFSEITSTGTSNVRVSSATLFVGSTVTLTSSATLKGFELQTVISSYPLSINGNEWDGVNYTTSVILLSSPAALGFLSYGKIIFDATASSGTKAYYLVKIPKLYLGYDVVIASFQVTSTGTIAATDTENWTLSICTQTIDFNGSISFTSTVTIAIPAVAGSTHTFGASNVATGWGTQLGTGEMDIIICVTRTTDTSSIQSIFRKMNIVFAEDKRKY